MDFLSASAPLRLSVKNVFDFFVAPGTLAIDNLENQTQGRTIE